MAGEEDACRFASRFPAPMGGGVHEEGTRPQSAACHTLNYHDEPSVERF